jgi:hypothetical protein
MSNSQTNYVIMNPDPNCKTCQLSTEIPSGRFVLPDPTSCIKDPFSDPTGSRFKVFGNSKNYSKYECDPRPDNVYRFLVQGTRNPTPCDLSQPYITFNGKNDTIDNMATCSDPKYNGYNRNGRFVQSIYHN